MEQEAKKRWNWWRAGDAAVLMTYASVVLWTIRYHEKWADEAQAWLLARDLDLQTIWFHELRYEGSPGLWHTILWVAQHVFHAKYDALGYIGATFAIAGAAVLVFWAPFPRIVRWPLAFTYVMIYQYAVIARPYTLLPLLAFCAALLFKDFKHPGRLTVVLVLLALLTLHGTILAGCLGLAYLVEAHKRRDELDATIRRRYIISAAVLAGTFVFIVATLRPTSDVEEIAVKQQLSQLPTSITGTHASFAQKITAITAGAFIDWLVPSVAMIILLALWCVWRRKWLAYALSVSALVLFYGLVHGAAHHHGTLFVAAITGLWIAWPSGQELLNFDGNHRLALLTANALLLVLCVVNIWDAGVVIQREYAYPYCGAEDAAKYLRAAGADQNPTFGFLFGVVAVQAYFDHNIFMNNAHAYFHHGLPLSTTVLNEEELYRIKPEYVVAYSNDPQIMLRSGAKELTSRGYELVHFSDGYYLYKQGVFERETYFIFRRSAGVSEIANTAASEIAPH
jgi:hypothetical protein